MCIQLLSARCGAAEVKVGQTVNRCFLNAVCVLVLHSVLTALHRAAWSLMCILKTLKLITLNMWMYKTPQVTAPVL